MEPWILVGLLIFSFVWLLLTFFGCSLIRKNRNRFHRYQILVSTECNPYQDWQNATLWWSVRNRWPEADATRLLACNSDERKNYKYLSLVPTIATNNWRKHPSLVEPQVKVIEVIWLKPFLQQRLLQK